MAWPIGGGRPLVRPSEQWFMEPTDVSVLVFNSDMANPTHNLVAPFILEQDADVVVVLEPVWEFFAGVVTFGIFGEPYPFHLVRKSEHDTMARILVLSKWGLSVRADEQLPNADGLVCEVHRPEELGGSFFVVVTHPPSPRNPQRWESGNQSVRHLSIRLRSLIKSGEQAVLAADLNATPGSVRDRILRTQAGITRSKPVLGRWGSYPASWGLGRIAIDDVWCSPKVGVRSWKTVLGPGSDHRAIRVVLSIPRRNNAHERGGSSADPRSNDRYDEHDGP
ncbi:MAG: endonuclease/exonuclease/phosphatase family protein, partial [Phycisphaerales bacterium]|nr:endonuclease/exonuclease/phosphatase family protein [Phycisphaerales bacterium]